MCRPTGSRWIAAILFLTVCVCRGELPELFRRDAFKAVTLAEAANHYVSLGKALALRELSELAAVGDLEKEQIDQARARLGIQGGFDIPERIGWMCRILFQSRTETPLRRPAYGGLMLPYQTMSEKSWPTYPIAASGRSYFVLAEGYALAGYPEHPRDYLAYCQANGTFRTTTIPVPTRVQAHEDVRALHDSPAWQAIKWTDRGENWSYTMDPLSTWNFINAQAELIE